MKRKKDRSPRALIFRMLSVICLAALPIVADNFINAPKDQPTAHLVAGLVHIYQDHSGTSCCTVFSPCRFVPSCSDYMIGAVFKYGSIKGTLMGLSRVSRCTGKIPANTRDFP